MKAMALVLALAAGASAQLVGNLQGWCEDGGKKVATQGINSTTSVQQSFPACTVTVYLTGTTTTAVIYSNATRTPLGNPFTATSAAQWTFWVAPGTYDIKFSGGGIASPFTRSGYTVPPIVSVTAFGCVGDNSTDDTTCITNAFAGALAASQPPCVYFPAGIYKITASLQLSTAGLCIEGESPWTTFINGNLGSNNPILNLGTFSTTQAPPWTLAGLMRVSNITFENTVQNNVSFVTAGTQTTIGIQSNGWGHLTLYNVQFAGLNYGFAAPYGSDFDRFQNTWCATNTVCLYMGPASEQFEITATEGHTNGEVVVCDGCQQGSIHNNHMVDSMTADITFERYQPTRSPFSWNPMTINSYDPYSEVTVEDNWFETGAGYGGITTWQEPRRILLQAGAGLTSYPRHITVDNSFLVLGSSGIAAMDTNPHSFIEFNQGRFLNVRNVDIVGDRRREDFYGGGGNRLNLTNLTIEDGYDATIPIFTFASGTYASNNWSYLDPWGKQGAPASIPTTCFTGSSQFFYDTTNLLTLTCQGTGGAGSLGTYSYLLQNLGDSTTLNAFQTQIFGGTPASHVGKWTVQNAGNPVDHVNFGGWTSADVQTVTLNPAAGLSGGTSNIGSVVTGIFRSSGVAFSGLGTPTPGTEVWCTDCMIATPCSGGGGGAYAFRTAAGTWNCPF